ncbi:bifunctional 3-(3-hydroxy-phenyl)propionate/3-hydroxycinnamic acid hydroxylase [Sphingobium subterraneum]|uniref:3-(3-hydroxy-phenyl)propionate hydroxylase n=1 Tax=Sphingobium subterraneum TaxID=627688 RepID=A0A841J4I1_9SPHN|nr:bifunctional 3-(3-hydroxy-phenyl)propionate/3-hydroxycinnamic acid hydroxylase [Sphingobium subterraneum]MBB6125242.1 3-(3-hydroxy-phenyl)propionate hydroxylase [Sphingobium subterraneum]
MSNVFDVIIVGAGPTGLTLANYLGMAGRHVLLVEANSATVGEPRAVSIDDESLRVMQDLGILDAVVSKTVAGYGTEYWSPARKSFLKVKPGGRTYGHPKRSAFRQPILEGQIREALDRFASVETRFSTRLSDIRTEDDGVVASLTDASGTVEVKGRYLIGADGGRSTVRQWLGTAMVGGSFDERWLIIDLEGALVPREDTVVYCDPKRPAIALPGPDNTLRYEFKLHPSEDEADLLTDISIADLLQRHDAPVEAKIVRRVVYRFHALIADCWGTGRIWLAGDAAHLTPPFAGQGMNSGIRDAIALGWRLDLILAGALGPGLMQSYQIEREDHVAQMIRLAVLVGKIMGPRNAVTAALTRIFFRSLRTWPRAHRYFAEMRYKPPPRFKRGFFVAGTSHRQGVGAMLPQPRLKDGTNRLLDDVLGRGFVLVGVDLRGQILEQIRLGEVWDNLPLHRKAIETSVVPELAYLSGKAVLLRPDRYVMAVFAPDDAQTCRDLGTLATTTWTDCVSGSPHGTPPLFG